MTFISLFFFFKQKTAYEIKECDWSSDVCSSDLCIYLEIEKILLVKFLHPGLIENIIFHPDTERTIGALKK